MMYRYLLQRARESYEWSTRSYKQLTELDFGLILLNVLIMIYSGITGIRYYQGSYTGVLVVSVAALILSTINIIIAVHRMIRRRKSEKISREFWETEIKMLEDKLDEDVESEVDVHRGSTGNIHG